MADAIRIETNFCAVRDRVFLEIESAVIRDPVMP